MTVLRHMLCACAAAAVLAAGGSAASAAQCGQASWYEMGTTTASGEAYNPDGLTAAHPNLPFGAKVRVENLRNGRSVRLRINDRGPFVDGRIIDVSRGAARRLGLVATGTARVRLSALNHRLSPRGCGPGDRAAAPSSPTAGKKWAWNAGGE